MRETIDKIVGLLGKLEQEAAGAATAERARVTGLELPDIIRDVVDLLFPELKPYEAAIFMYLLRQSVIETGSFLIRVSRRGLTGVVKSTKATTGEMSYASIQQTLMSLETLGVIRRESDPNREGTLYRVLLPEEMELCQKAREQRDEVTSFPIIDEAREADFYNVRENRIKVYERDNYCCRYCEKQLTRFTATLDHVQAVAEGGDNSFGNLVTACLDCNSRKNVRPLGDFLAEHVITTQHSE